MSSTLQESCCQIRWRPYFEEEQWEVTDKTVFTKLNRGLAGFHSLLGYLSPGNQGWSAVSPTRISNKVVTTSEYNNTLWNLTPGGSEQHFLNLICMKCKKKITLLEQLLCLWIWQLRRIFVLSFFYNIQTFDYRSGCEHSMTQMWNPSISTRPEM